MGFEALWVVAVQVVIIVVGMLVVAQSDDQAEVEGRTDRHVAG